MLIPFLLIVNHFIADFVCQTYKMAINKSTSLKWLSIHVLAYMCAFVPFAFYMDSIHYEGVELWFSFTTGILWLLTNGILHWITDFFTSKLTAYLWKKEKRHWFFVAIGADQVIHYGCLLFTYQYFIMK